MRVGVIGLGIMGAPMARNLLRAGHEVLVPSLHLLRANGKVLAGQPNLCSAAAFHSQAEKL